MTGPGGDEVARVSVRVVPNTDDFKRDLERQLREIRDAEIKAQLDLDKDDLERELRELNSEDIKIPVKFNVENVQDDIDRATRGAKAGKVTVPVEVDDSTLRESVRLIPIDPIHAQLLLDEDRLNDEIARVQATLDELDDRTVTPHVELLQASFQAQLRDLNSELDTLQRRRLEIPVDINAEAFRTSIDNVTRALDPFDVPVEADGTRFSQTLRQALADGELITRNPVLFKLEADRSALDREIAEIETEIQRLRNQGVEMEFRARTEALEDQIAKVRSTLDALSQEEASPQVKLQIDEQLARLAAFQAELGALDREEINIDVQARLRDSMVKLAALATQVEALENRHLDIVANLDVDDDAAFAELNLFRARQRANAINIPVNIDVDRNRLAAISSGIVGTLVRAMDAVAGSVGRIVPTISNVFSKLNSWVDPLGETNQSLIGMAGRLGTVLGVATQAAGPLLYLSALGTGIALAGAAITAAWGGVAAVLGTIPGLIALIGVPIGVVALGMDGIKKAAEALNPQFTKLKETVSATFEKTMTPAMKQLATLFPKITYEVNQVARAISLVATDLAQWVTSAQGVARVEEILRRVAQAIDDMRPGILDTITTFTLLASQASVFNVLTGAVNEFGRAFREAVLTSIVDGSFNDAMRGLQGTLEALTRGFVSLVQNGISVFAAAAPGINHSLDSLTNFFNRFDWESLGAAVGAVFDGLASALDRVPQGTIEAITQGFERLGATFQTAGFQQALLDVINAIPLLLGGLQSGVEGLARFAQAFVGTIDIVRGFVNNFGVVWDLLEGEISWDEADRKIREGQALIEGGLGTVLNSVRDWGPQVGSAMQSGMATVPASANAAMTELKAKIAAGLVDAKSAIPAGFSGVGTATATALAPVAPAAAGAVANVGTAVSGEMAQVPPAANAALAPIQQLDALRGMRDQFTIAAADSMHAMSVGVQSGMAEVQQQFKAGMDTASSGLSGSFTLMEQGMTIGMSGLAQQVSLGMSGVQQAFSTGFSGIATSVGTSIAPIRANIAIAMAGLTQEVANGMITVTLAFQAGFNGIAVGIGTSIAPIRANIAIAMGGISQEVTNGMIQVTLAFQAGFANIAVGVGTAIAPIRTNLGIAMVGLAQEITNGMLGVQNAFTTGFALVGANIGTSIAPIRSNLGIAMVGLGQEVTNGMLGVQNAFTSGFSNIAVNVGTAIAPIRANVGIAMGGIAQEVTTGMTNVRNAFSQGFAGIATGVGATVAPIRANIGIAMAGLAQEVTTGMTNISNSFRAGFANIGGAVPGMMSPVKSGMAIGMTAVVQEVNLGMIRAGATIGTGIANLVRIVSAASGQMRSAGAQMMQGMRAGILSQAGSIAAAAAQVVSQAIAAARAAAQVRSPSRVFMGIGLNMGAGLALGMEKSGPRVERAADTMISSVAGIADQMTSTFSDAKWAADFGAKVENSLGDTSVDLSNADVVGAIRRQSGDLDQSATLGSILVVLQAMYAQSKQGGSVALAAQGSRRAAELGAF